MIAWIEAMSVLEKIFFFTAAPATVIMIIQTIMLFFGGDAGDTNLGADTSGLSNGSFNSAAEVVGGDLDDIADVADMGLRFITMRGIITFMTVFGWAGVCFIEMGLPLPIVAALSTLLGLGSMVGVAYIIYGLLKLQASGNINYREALGKYADVYLTIPPDGTGKVTLTLSGAMSEYDAVTHSGEAIKTGEVVRVTDIIRGNVMVVERNT